MKKLVLLLSICPLISSAQIDAEEVLKKAVSYHDPNGDWSSLNATFIFKETRPEGPDRGTTITLDNSKGFMNINRNDEEIYEVNGEDAKVLKGDIDQQRAIVLRNYYLYLWGLPMKLYDKDTPMNEKVDEETIKGIDCYVLRVPYEKDTWYFSIDKETGRMVQYKFYQDAAETKGELIKLEDEVEVGSLKIPQRRSWYTLPEMKYLGTDILENVE